MSIYISLALSLSLSIYIYIYILWYKCSPWVPSIWDRVLDAWEDKPSGQRIGRLREDSAAGLQGKDLRKRSCRFIHGHRYVLYEGYV